MYVHWCIGATFQGAYAAPPSLSRGQRDLRPSPRPSRHDACAAPRHVPLGTAGRRAGGTPRAPAAGLGAELAAPRAGVRAAERTGLEARKGLISIISSDREELVRYRAFEVVLSTSKAEGIIPALETAHAIAQTAKLAPKLRNEQVIVVNLSGRGDKDCQEVARLIEAKHPRC